MSGTGERTPSRAAQAISRREAVRRIALLMGAAVVGSDAKLSGQAVPDKAADGGFSDRERALMDEIGETIIPATDTPGAKAAGIGAFMAKMVTDCYSDSQHATFKAGLTAIDDACAAQFGKSFMDCAPEQRTALCNGLEKAQREQFSRKAKDEPVHYFRMMKELSIIGFFSSEIGCSTDAGRTPAVRYVEVPGAFHGDIAYAKGDKAWY